MGQEIEKPFFSIPSSFWDLAESTNNYLVQNNSGKQ